MKYVWMVMWRIIVGKKFLLWVYHQWSTLNWRKAGILLIIHLRHLKNSPLPESSDVQRVRSNILHAAVDQQEETEDTNI